MKLALPVIVVALAVVTSASASSKLAQRVGTAASRSGFSGEVAVARHGRIVFAHGYGLANRARGQRVTLDTAFNLASMGKMFTGVAAAQLVEAGKLRFGDRIGQYLPQLPARMRSITVAQLLDHTSGLGDFFGDPGYERLLPRLTTLGAYLPLVKRESLQFKPGTHWSYSNSGFLLAGLVIEKVSGQPFWSFLSRRILKPLGMDGHSQKLSDFMINEGMPKRARNRWPLLCCEDEVIWVPGYRPAHRYRLKPASRRILYFALVPPSEKDHLD